MSRADFAARMRWTLIAQEAHAAFGAERYMPTFAQFSDVASRVVPLDLDERVPVLWAKYDQEVSRVIGSMWEDPELPMKPSELRVAIAFSVIIDHLGTDWFDRNIKLPLAAARDAPPVVKVLHRYRAIELAQSLYELQSFPWFDAMTNKLKNDTFSGVAFELKVLSMLTHLPATSAPQVESGTRGADFDIGLHYKGQFIPVEVKAKEDTTTWSVSTVISTIKQAAKQMPSGGAGVVFLRIPPAWVGPTLEERYADALHEATRQSSRIEAIISVIDKPSLTSGSTGNVTSVFHTFRRSDPLSDDVWEFARLFADVMEIDELRLGPVAPF